jgi:hypothetical protein
MDILSAKTNASGSVAGIERNDIIPVNNSYTLPELKKLIFMDTDNLAVTLSLAFTSAFTTEEQLKVISALRSELEIILYKLADNATAETVAALADTSTLKEYYSVKYLLPVNNNLYSVDASKDLSICIPEGRYLISAAIREILFMPAQPTTRRLKHYERLQIASLPATAADVYYSNMTTQMKAVADAVAKMAGVGLSVDQTGVIAALGSVKDAVSAVGTTATNIKTDTAAIAAQEVAIGTKIDAVKTAIDGA